MEVQLGATPVGPYSGVFPVTSPTLHYVIFLSDTLAAGSEMIASQKVFKMWFILVLV